MELLMIAQVVTTVGEGAFIGAESSESQIDDLKVLKRHSSELQNGMYRQTGAAILGNEARQNSKLREELGLDYFNGKSFLQATE